MYGQNGEAIILTRDCEAVAIPAGNTVILPGGTEVFITQALGGSFTVYVMGNLFRIAGQDADALDQEAVSVLELPPNASDKDVEKRVWDQLKTCFDPEIPVNIVDLGLVYACTLEHLEGDTRKVSVKMTLTAPGCGMGTILVDDVKSKIESIPTIQTADVELVFDPPWDQSMMSDVAKLETGMF